MKQEERLLFLIKALLREAHMQEIEIPKDYTAQKRLYRALCNIREPKPLNDAFLNIQDAFLQEENQKDGITSMDDLSSKEKGIYLWQGDITTLKVDAIVNAANSALLGCFIPEHGCIDNIIHTKSGNQLRLYCDAIMRKQGHLEPTGHAKITPGFNLPCRHILHTVGPIVQGTLQASQKKQLALCYRSCLELACKHQCTSIAFCCISTGEFHFPNALACQIAIDTIRSFLKENNYPIQVIFNVFKDQDRILYERELNTNA